MTDKDKEIAARLHAAAATDAARAAQEEADALALDAENALPAAPVPVTAPAPVPISLPPTTSPVGGGTTDPAGPANPAPAPAPPVTLTRDMLEAELGFHYAYKTGEVQEAQLAGLAQSFPPSVPQGAMSLVQIEGGEQPGIGLIPDFAALYVVSMDPRAFGHLKANAHCLPNFPHHIRTADGVLAKPWEHPTAGEGDFPADATATIPRADIDLQHQEHVAYVYALACGLLGDTAELDFAIEELRARVGFNFFDIPPEARKGGVGIVNQQNSLVGLRGGAWDLLALGQFVHVLERFDRTDDAWYAWAKNALEETLLFLQGLYITGTIDTRSWGLPYYGFAPGWGVNKLGLFLGGKMNPDDNPAPGGPVHQRAFMQAFMCQAVLAIAVMKITLRVEAEVARQACADFACLWVTGINGKPNDPASFDFRFSPMYDFYGGIARADDGCDWPATFAAAFAANKAANNWPDLDAADPNMRAQNGQVLGGTGGGYLANELVALSMAVDRKYPGAAEAFARVRVSPQIQAHDCAIQFAIFPSGQYFTDPITQATAIPPALVGTPVGKDGDTITAVAGIYKYGVSLAVATANLNGHLVPAGDYYATVTLAAGSVQILPAALGVADPCLGIVKQLYLVSTAVPVTASPAPAPVAISPAPTPAPVVIVSPAPTDPTLDVEVDPATWLLKDVGWGPIPGWKNTPRSVMPAWAQDTQQVSNFMTQWPGAAFSAKRLESRAFNGGHQTWNTPGVLVARFKTMSFALENVAPAAKLETDFPRDGYPDEHGNLQVFHGYTGHAMLEDVAGFPDRLLLVGMYGPDGQKVPNPLSTYEAGAKTGGGGTHYPRERNRFFSGTGGIGATVAVAPSIGGFFIGDNYTYDVANSFCFVPFDPSVDPTLTGDQNHDPELLPQMVDQFSFCRLWIDDAAKVVCALNTGSNGAMLLKSMGYDRAKPETYKKIASRYVAPEGDLSFLGEVQADRGGFCLLKGKGIVGLHRLPSSEVVGLQIYDKAGQLTMRCVFRNIPAYAWNYGVFGSHLPIDELGITVCNSAADTAPIQFNWPTVPA